MRDEITESELMRALGEQLSGMERSRGESKCPAVSRFWAVAVREAEWADAEKSHVEACARCRSHIGQVQAAIANDAQPKATPAAARRRRVSPKSFAIAASVVLGVGVVMGAAYSIERERKLRRELSHHQLLLDAKNEEIRALALLEHARTVLTLPSHDRRQKAQDLVKEAIKVRAALPPGEVRDRIDAEIRSVFAASLAYPTVRVTDDNQLRLAPQTQAAFLTHPTAILPDGTGMAVATRKRPYFWKRGTKPDWPGRLDPKEDFEQTDRSPRIQYSPDGLFLAFAPQVEGGLVLWDGECTQQMRTPLIPAGGPGSVVLAIGFSPDAKRLFAVRADGTVPSWKLPSHEANHEWPLAEKPAGIVCARFSADNGWLALADAKGIVTLFGADGKKVAAVPCGEVADALAWSPDNQTVAIGLRSGTILAAGRDGVTRFRVPGLYFGASMRLQFTPDGQFLLCGARNQPGRIFNAQTGERVATHQFAVWSFSQDGRWFSGGSGEEVAFVEFVPPTVVRRVGGSSPDIIHIVWSKDARRVATLDSLFELRVVDVTRTNPLVARVAEKHNGMFAGAAGIALSNDGSHVGYVSGGRPKAYFRVLEVETGKEVGRWDDLPAGFYRVAATGPGRFVCVGEELEEPAAKRDRLKSVARVFEVGKKGPVSERVLRKSEATDIGMFMSHFLTPDGKFYAWGGPRRFGPGGGRRVEVFNVETGERVTRIPVTNTGGAHPAPVLSPDGTVLWYGRDTGGGMAVRLADPRPPVEEAYLPYAIAPDLARVARSRSDLGAVNQLELASWPDGRPWLHLANADQSGPSGVGQPISPDGRFLAFGSDSGVLTLVDLPKLEEELKEIEKELQKAMP